MSDAQAELELTREQLARAERALQAIRRDVLPVNEARHRLMAEGYVDQIQRLRAQIDAYLGIDAVLESQSNVVISLEGTKVRLGDTAVGVLTKVVDAFRLGLQKLVTFRSYKKSSQASRGRHKRWIEQLCDLPLVAVQPGSVRVVLGEPDMEGVFAEEDRAFLQENLRVLLAGVEWAASEKMDYPPEIEADPSLRHLLLKVLLDLAPPRDGPVEAVGFHGAAMGRNETVRLRSVVRQRLNAALADFERESATEVTGVIREVDLDKRTFCLRERPQQLPSLNCEYEEANEKDVKSYLDEPVIVTGILRTEPKSQNQKMKVESIEPDLSREAGSKIDVTEASRVSLGLTAGQDRSRAPAPTE